MEGFINQFLSPDVCQFFQEQYQALSSRMNDEHESIGYNNRPDPHETVSLSPLLFKQLGDLKTEINEDRLIATRSSEDSSSFVGFRNSFTSFEFILIQILEIDERIGGLNLQYLDKDDEWEPLFVGHSIKAYDYVIFWINRKGELFYKMGEDGEVTQSPYKISPHKPRRYKLRCELRGCVKQIRAFVGLLNRDNEKPKPPVESGVDVANQNPGDATCFNNSFEDSVNNSSVESSKIVRNADGSNSQHVSPQEPQPKNISLTLKIKYENFRRGCPEITVEEIKVNNLPANSHSTCNSTDVCCSSDETRLYGVETCNICMDKDADTVLVPCGHLICCYECASRCATRCGSKCPICREEIKDCHKIFSRIASCHKCRLSPANVVLLPCRDACLCDSCSTNAIKCPTCQMWVDDYQKIV